MQRLTIPTALAALMLTLSACSGAPAEEPLPEELGVPEEAGADTPDEPAEPLPWGETATVVGNSGTEVELTPEGIRYFDGDGLAEEYMVPEGVYVIAQVGAEALEASETLTWTDTDGFAWRLDGQQVGRGEGGEPPWEGRTEGFYGEPILPGEGIRSGLVFFDIAEPGGFLSYVDGTGTVTRWEVPTESEGDEGPLWDDVDEAIAEWS